MRRRPNFRKQNRSFKQARTFIDTGSSASVFARRADQAADAFLKGTLWLGYGFALVSWFVAVNTVILFTQMLKCK